MNDETSSSNQSRIEELLEAIVRLLIAPILAKEIDDPKLRKLYEATGSMTTAEIVKKLHMSTATICATWKRWEAAGLIVKSGKSYKKVV